ncbi:MAG: preprotein translocase subunit TatC [Phycisphaerales bacterium]|nr:preprotein translocase subunit TatC [Phycisphaerales bacterium]
MPRDQDHLQDEGGGGMMSFGDHLDELRTRLVKALVVPFVLAIAVFSGASHVRGFLVRPLVTALAAEGQPTNLQVLSPTESLMVDLQISIWTAVVASLPWIMWQLWLFVSPGLFAHERRYARFLVPLSTILAAAGLTGLYLVMPYMLRMLISFGAEPPRAVAAAVAPDAAVPAIPVLEADPPDARPGQLWMLKSDGQLYVAVDAGRKDGALEVRTVATRTTGDLSQQYRLQEYVDFLLFFAVAVAVAFQMPVAVLLLGWVGILDTRMLRKHWRHALFACAIIAAVISPTIDAFSMVALTIPLYMLYELGIVLLTIAPSRAVAEGGVVRNALGTLVGRPKYRRTRTDGNEGDE